MPLRFARGLGLAVSISKKTAGATGSVNAGWWSPARVLRAVASVTAAFVAFDRRGADRGVHGRLFVAAGGAADPDQHRGRSERHHRLRIHRRAAARGGPQ